MVLLSKLHLVVELTALSQTFLALPPPDTLRTMVHSALSTLTSFTWDQVTHDYSFPLPTHTLREQLPEGKVGPVVEGEQPLPPAGWSVLLRPAVFTAG